MMPSGYESVSVKIAHRSTQNALPRYGRANGLSRGSARPASLEKIVRREWLPLHHCCASEAAGGNVGVSDG